MNKNIEEVNRKRDIIGIRIVQGLCLALILVIHYALCHMHLPHAASNRLLSNTDTAEYLFWFNFLIGGMLTLIIVVLEFCKEIKYSIEENYKS